MKRYCVLSGSRTGSTMLQMVLWRYVNRKLGYKHALGDFMLRNWAYDTGSSVATIRLSHMSPLDAWHLKIDHKFEYNRRIDLLKKYHNQMYFVKFPADFWLYCDYDKLQYLYDNYHFVVIDRKDKRERALSYAISIISNWFTIRKEGQEKLFIPGEFTKEMGYIIRHDFWALEVAKAKVMNTSGVDYDLLWYEDMIQYDDRFEILGSMLGLRDWKNFIKEDDRNTLSRKVGDLIDKNSYITNLGEFDEWVHNNLHVNTT